MKTINTIYVLLFQFFKLMGAKSDEGSINLALGTTSKLVMVYFFLVCYSLLLLLKVPNLIFFIGVFFLFIPSALEKYYERKQLDIKVIKDYQEKTKKQKRIFLLTGLLLILLFISSLLILVFLI